MSKPQIDTEGGQVLLKFDNLAAGKLSLADFGLTDADLAVQGGNLRFVLSFDGLGDGHAHVFKFPTVYFHYDTHVGESGWKAELNGATVLDKTDKGGSNSLILINKKTFSDHLKPRHNELVIHADFPADVRLSATETYFHLVEVPGSEHHA